MLWEYVAIIKRLKNPVGMTVPMNFEGFGASGANLKQCELELGDSPDEQLVVFVERVEKVPT